MEKLIQLLPQLQNQRLKEFKIENHMTLKKTMSKFYFKFKNVEFTITGLQSKEVDNCISTLNYKLDQYKLSITNDNIYIRLLFANGEHIGFNLQSISEILIYDIKEV